MEIIKAIDLFALLYLMITCIIFFIFSISASIILTRFKSQSDKRQGEIMACKESFPLSILVPAYNEELTICLTIDSLINQEYIEFEIIIINDGSLDNTLENIIKEYDLNLVCKNINDDFKNDINIELIKTNEVINVYEGIINKIPVMLIDKVNGGKSDALNVGINYCKNPIFVTVDADSILQYDAIKNIIKPFVENKKTVACGGNIKIVNNLNIIDGKVETFKNPKGIIIAIQIIEYLRSFFLSRPVWGAMNMNFIISGAFGAFNKKVIMELGGYKVNTIGEDMELVMRMHKYFIKNKIEYNINFVPNANCYTQAPTNLKGLKNQRRRWQLGLIESLGTHKNMFINKEWFLAKCYFILFEMITPIVEFTGIFILILIAIIDSLNVKFLIIYYLSFFSFTTAVSILAVMINSHMFNEKKSKLCFLKLILVIPLEAFGYRQIINFYRISAFFIYRKNKNKWGTIERKKHQYSN